MKPSFSPLCPNLPNFTVQTIKIYFLDRCRARPAHHLRRRHPGSVLHFFFFIFILKFFIRVYLSLQVITSKAKCRSYHSAPAPPRRSRNQRPMSPAASQGQGYATLQK